jgi:hypothetical protein
MNNSLIWGAGTLSLKHSLNLLPKSPMQAFDLAMLVWRLSSTQTEDYGVAGQKLAEHLGTKDGIGITVDVLRRTIRFYPPPLERGSSRLAISGLQVEGPREAGCSIYSGQQKHTVLNPIPHNGKIQRVYCHYGVKTTRLRGAYH